MDEIKILYFLEDRAQEGFIKQFVKRIACDESIPIDCLTHNVRSSRGGSSRVVNEFKKFVKDTRNIAATDTDFVVVAIDGNCKGHTKLVGQLEKCIKNDHPFKGRVVYAVPDPHIERWYLMDQGAFKRGVGLDSAPSMPRYKCERAYYKQVLNQALRDSNLSSLLGGAEYAERIIEEIADVESLYDQNAGFQSFALDLKRMFRSFGSLGTACSIEDRNE